MKLICQSVRLVLSIVAGVHLMHRLDLPIDPLRNYVTNPLEGSTKLDSAVRRGLAPLYRGHVLYTIGDIITRRPSIVQ